jgi:hypothetical protein
MALSNYDELQAAIVDFSPEIATSDPISTFIALAEGDVFPRLKHFKAETTVTLTSADNAVAIPDNCNEIRAIRVDGVIAKLVSVYGAELYAGEIGYFQSGDSLVIVPAQAAPRSVQLTYFARPAALSDTVSTNWLLTKFPAVYLHSALARAYRWRQNPQAEAGEKQSLEEALALVALDHKTRTQGGNTVILNGGNPYAA